MPLAERIGALFSFCPCWETVDKFWHIGFPCGGARVMVVRNLPLPIFLIVFYRVIFHVACFFPVVILYSLDRLRGLTGCFVAVSPVINGRFLFWFSVVNRLRILRSIYRARIPLSQPNCESQIGLGFL